MGPSYSSSAMGTYMKCQFLPRQDARLHHSVDTSTVHTTLCPATECLYQLNEFPWMVASQWQINNNLCTWTTPHADWVQFKYLGQDWTLWPKTQHIIVKQNEARIQIQKPKPTSQLVATPACNKCRTLICAWTTFWSIWIWWQLIVSYIFRYIATNTGGSKRRS